MGFGEIHLVAGFGWSVAVILHKSLLENFAAVWSVLSTTVAAMAA